SACWRRCSASGGRGTGGVCPAAVGGAAPLGAWPVAGAPGCGPGAVCGPAGTPWAAAGAPCGAPGAPARRSSWPRPRRPSSFGAGAAACVGATSLTLRAGAAPAAAGCCGAAAAGSAGRPGLAASAACRAANAGGGAGGLVLATTSRCSARAGGLCWPPAVAGAAAAAATRLARVGATRATGLTGCRVITSRGTWTAARATGCDCTKCRGGHGRYRTRRFAIAVGHIGHRGIGGVVVVDVRYVDVGHARVADVDVGEILA